MAARQRARVLTSRRGDLTAGFWHDMTGPAFPAVYAWLAASDQLSIESSNAADTGGGVGAQQVECRLLDAAFVESFVTVTLNGTTKVPIPGGPFYRCNGLRVVQAGSAGIEDGSSGGIKLTADTGGEMLARIKGGGTSSAGCVYTMPSNRRVRPVRLDVEVLGPKSASARVLTGLLQSRVDGETSWSEEIETRELNEEHPRSTTELRDFDFSAGTDLRVRALTDTTLAKAYSRLIMYEGHGVVSP